MLQVGWVGWDVRQGSMVQHGALQREISGVQPATPHLSCSGAMAPDSATCVPHCCLACPAADRNPSFANVSADLHRGRAVLCRLEQEIAKLAPSPGVALVLRCAVLRCAVLCCAALCCAVLCRAVLCCAVL